MDTSSRSISSSSSIKKFQPVSFIPGKVFLTEAKQEIAIPQGLDENPLYEQMLVKQMRSEKIITRTGLHKPDESSDKKVWKENYSKQSLELEKIKAFERQKQINERYDQEMRRQEENRAKQEAFYKRKYLQYLKKITFEPNDPKYLKSPFQPGFYFYEALLTNPKYPCSLLHINIPHTFYISESRTYWITTNEESGRVQSLQDYNKFEVHNSLQRYKDEQLGVIAIFRHPVSATNMEANPLNSLEFSDKILKGSLPSGTMVQRYIKSHSDRPCTIRLFYNNKNKENRASYAYCITSSQRAMEKFSQTKICVCSQIVDGIDIYPMHGEAILGLESYAKEIVEFLQNAYTVRIIDIVLDFIKDKDGKCWFIGCKGFNLDENALKCREIRIENEKIKSPAVIRDELEEIREQRLSSMHCKLCLLPFKLFELEHVLPYKMLLLYKRHTRKSGRKSLQLSHIRPLAIDFLSHWVRVCNICHMLVLQEYELMETEIKLAKKLNISIKPEDLTRKPTYKHPPFLPSVAMQWRVLIYLKNIDYINFKSWREHNLYLNFNIFEKSHIIKLPQSPYKNNKIRLRRTRLFYFFTQDAAHCKNLCNSEIMKLTMIENKTKIISAGESNPFKLFSCEMEDKESITQLWEVPLFLNQIHFMNLKFVVGLAKDHSLNPRKLPVNINKYKTIYMPDDTYFSCEPLPIGWMELFNEKYKEDITSQLLSSSEEIEDVYSPELNEDLIYSSPMISGKILHVNVDLDPRKKPKNNFSIESFERRNFSPSKKILSPSTSKSQITDLTSTRIRSAKHTKASLNSASTSLTTSAMLLKKPSKSLVSPTYVPNRTSIVSPESTNCGHSKNASVDEIYSCKQDVTDPSSRIENLLNTVSVYLTRRGYNDKSEAATSPQCSPKHEKEQSEDKSQKKIIKRKVYRDQSNNSYNGKVTSRLNRLLEVYLA
ncbi:unnamed protein product [Blepharisma stoltei]|uniref:Uncharacterized protein n=1 Tax=Blepharisma stoltei TaxID=1481888 RepID=A0AAU9IZG1_9CILI|nr:unnamed protein product [Blepharisma stoltei]